MNINFTNSFILAFTFCITIALIYACYLVMHILLLSLIGIGVGALLSPVLVKIKDKTKISRTFGALIIYFVVIVVSVAIFYWIGVIALEQFNNLIADFPQLKEKYTIFIDGFSLKHPEIADFFASMQLSDDLLGPEKLTKTLFKGFSSLGNITTSLLFIAVIGFFTAIRATSYFEGFVGQFPKRNQQKIRRALNNMASSLRLWFRAQLLDMLVVGVLTSLGLWIVGVKYWLVVGLFTALFSLIPYVGILVSTLLATTLVIARAPDKIFWVWLVYLITQQIEGNVILPYILRKKVSLPEVPLLIGMFIMIKWFGILGALIAPPLLAIAIVLYKEVKNEGLI